MNLRTITFWVLYDPLAQVVIATRQFKYQVKRVHQPEGTVVVKLKGHYLRPAESTTAVKGRG